MIDFPTSVSENKNKYMEKSSKRDAQRFNTSISNSKENFQCPQPRNQAESEKDTSANSSAILNGSFLTSQPNGSPIKSQRTSNISDLSRHSTIDSKQLNHSINQETQNSDHITLLQEKCGRLHQEVNEKQSLILELHNQLKSKDINTKSNLESFELFDIPIGRIINNHFGNINEITLNNTPISLNDLLKNVYPNVLGFLTEENKSTFESTSKENDLLKKELKKLQEQNNSLNVEIKTLEDENNKLNATNNTLSNQHDTLKSEYETLKQQSDKSSKDNNSFKHQIETLTNENEIIQEELEKVTEDKKSLKEDLEISTKQNDILTKETETLKREIEFLTDKSETFQSLSDNFLKPLESKLKERENEFKIIVDELSIEKSKVEQLESQLEVIKCIKTQKITYDNLKHPNITSKEYNALNFEVLEEYDVVKLQNLIKQTSLNLNVPVDKLEIALPRDAVLIELCAFLLKYTDWFCNEWLDVEYDFHQEVETCINIYLKTGDKAKARLHFKKIVHEMEKFCSETFGDIDEYES